MHFPSRCTSSSARAGASRRLRTTIRAEPSPLLQRENGSWVNEAERWFEGDPNLATAFALMALAYCDPVEVEAAAAE